MNRKMEIREEIAETCWDLVAVYHRKTVAVYWDREFGRGKHLKVLAPPGLFEVLAPRAGDLNGIAPGGFGARDRN